MCVCMCYQDCDHHYQKMQFDNIYTCEINKYSLEVNNARKRVAPGGAQTHTSCCLGEHPNHLDHQHYMLFPCFSSSLRAYWSSPGP